MTEQEKKDLGKTQIKRLEQYRDRWTSYGASTGILEISEKLTPSELKKLEILKDYEEKFLEKISPDISVAKWKKDTVLFEEGSYIDLAFFILNGTVEVYLKKQRTSAALGEPIFDLSRTVMLEGLQPTEVDRAERVGAQTIFQSQIAKQPRRKTEITFLSAMDFDLPVGEGMKLGAGEIFGEIGALSGWPQSVTAQTRSECELLQIRVSALQQMRRKSTALKGRLDKIYRERSLLSQLRTTPLFRGCDDAFMEALTKKVELISCEPDEIITKQGEPPDALFLVRSGFVKLSQQLGEGQIVVSYLSKGSTFGEAELLIEGIRGWLYTASSQEYTELVRIAREDFYQITKQYPRIEKSLLESAVSRIKEAGKNRRNIQQSEYIETALEKGLVEGNSILIIDLNVCTRCDDCVRACADTHGGIPRFVREGDKYENFQITRACYHCRDPVCLVGCPTGAIRRAAVGDVVEIDEKLCIGCNTCARNCPYDAIVMYETGEVWPGDMLPEGLRAHERLLATKCDLCYDTGHGPACVSNCPHNCAFRIGSVEEFQDLLSKSK